VLSSGRQPKRLAAPAAAAPSRTTPRNAAARRRTRGTAASARRSSRTAAISMLLRPRAAAGRVDFWTPPCSSGTPLLGACLTRSPLRLGPLTRAFALSVARSLRQPLAAGKFPAIKRRSNPAPIRASGQIPALPSSRSHEKSLTDRWGFVQGRKLWSRFTVHYTPKHGSWLNSAEIEASMWSRECLGRDRFPALDQLQARTRSWNRQTDRSRQTIQWRFTSDKARRVFRYRRR
jgi:hypothetical protein